MKKILLLSDTHGYMAPDIISYAEKADEIWHAGDIGTLTVTDELQKHAPVRAVFGNIDDAVIRATFPQDSRFFCERVDVFMTHIGGYPGRYVSRIRPVLIKKTPQLFVCGHSHILKVMWDKTNNLLHINPGAVGKYGFHQIRTMVRFVITDDRISNLEVIEMKKR